MRAYVLTDAALTKHAGRFAWLAIDSEKPKNAGLVQKFPFEALPAFLVIDAKSEKVVLKWYGTATVDQLARLMDDGVRASAGGGEAAEAVLARADRLNGEGKKVEAAGLYAEAIRSGGSSWAGRERAAESLVMAWQLAGKPEECGRAAVELAPGLPRARSFLNVVATGLSCALDGDNAAWAGEAMAKLRPLGEEAARLPDQLGDDRASMYDTLLDVFERQKSEDAGKQMTREFAEFLDREEKTAPTVEARASLDSWRTSLALRMKDPGRAIPALQASERDLPGDYNPPARLAMLYSGMGRYDDALAASDRALAKVYGPRRIQVLTTRSSIYQKMGDKPAARGAIEEAIKVASSLPNGEKRVAALQKQLERLK